MELTDARFAVRAEVFVAHLVDHGAAVVIQKWWHTLPWRMKRLRSVSGWRFGAWCSTTLPFRAPTVLSSPTPHSSVRPCLVFLVVSSCSASSIVKVQPAFVLEGSMLSVGRSACLVCTQQSSALFLQELEWSVVGKMLPEVSRRFVLECLVKYLIVLPPFPS